MKAHHYKDEGWTTFERNERFPLIVLPTSPRRTLKAYGGLAEGVDTRCSMYLSREVGKFFGLSRECHVSSVSSRFSFLFFSFFSLRFSFFFFSLARWSSCVSPMASPLALLFFSQLDREARTLERIRTERICFAHTSKSVNSWHVSFFSLFLRTCLYGERKVKLSGSSRYLYKVSDAFISRGDCGSVDRYHQFGFFFCFLFREMSWSWCLV